MQEAVGLLKYELELSMALLGCPTVQDITPDHIIHPPGFPLAVPGAVTRRRQRRRRAFVSLRSAAAAVAVGRTLM